MDMESIISLSLIIISVFVLIGVALAVYRVREHSVQEFAPVQTPVEMLHHSHWYEKPFLLILAILLICPVGLYGLYKNLEISRRRRLEMIC